MKLNLNFILTDINLRSSRDLSNNTDRGKEETTRKSGKSKTTKATDQEEKKGEMEQKEKVEKEKERRWRGKRAEERCSIIK